MCCEVVEIKDGINVYFLRGKLSAAYGSTMSCLTTFHSTLDGRNLLRVCGHLLFVKKSLYCIDSRQVSYTRQDRRITVLRYLPFYPPRLSLTIVRRVADRPERSGPSKDRPIFRRVTCSDTVRLADRHRDKDKRQYDSEFTVVDDCTGVPRVNIGSRGKCDVG